MASPAYSLDTNVFIECWHTHYPPDVFPTLWTRLGALLKEGMACASEGVKEDLSRKSDEILDWCESQRIGWVASTEEVQLQVADILSHEEHRRLLDTRRNRSGSDPFVIAVAELGQMAVVTYELPSASPKRPRIPDVCAARGVSVFGVLELFRREGWAL